MSIQYMRAITQIFAVASAIALLLVAGLAAFLYRKFRR